MHAVGCSQLLACYPLDPCPFWLRTCFIDFPFHFLPRFFFLFLSLFFLFYLLSSFFLSSIPYSVLRPSTPEPLNPATVCVSSISSPSRPRPLPNYPSSYVYASLFFPSHLHYPDPKPYKKEKKILLFIPSSTPCTKFARSTH